MAADHEPDDTPSLLLRTATSDDLTAAEALLGCACPAGPELPPSDGDGSVKGNTELWVLVDPADDPDDRVHGAALTRSADPAVVEIATFATRGTDPRVRRQLLVALANILRRRGCRRIMVSLREDQATEECMRSVGLRPVDARPSGQPHHGATRPWLLEL